MPSFEDNFFTQRHKICSHETRDHTLSDGENPVSLSHLGLIRHLVVTTWHQNRRTDRQTDGQTLLR